MTRVAAKVTCSDQDRKELERLGSSRTDQARLVERAKIVLGCLAGERNDQIAARMKLQANTVAMWRKRFMEGGIAALHMTERAVASHPSTMPATCAIEYANSLNLLHPKGFPVGTEER